MALMDIRGVQEGEPGKTGAVPVGNRGDEGANEAVH